MQIVVAGGTGLIGRPFVEDLANDGHEVVVLSRNPDRYIGIMPRGVTIGVWDAAIVGKWAQHLDGADAVVNFSGENLAGENFLPDRWTEDKKRRIRESRIKAGKALVEAIKEVENKPQVLIQSSAIGYYGPTGDSAISESSPPGDDFLALICIEWEATTAEVESLGVRRVITRTGLILSTEGGPLARLLPLYRLYAGGYFGDGKQWWSWIHMDDEIRALRFLMESEEARGAYNLTAPNPVTNRDFGKTLGKVIGKPSIMPAPGFAVKMVVGEVATVVLDGQRVVPRNLQELGFTYRFQELEPALRDLLDT